MVDGVAEVADLIPADLDLLVRHGFDRNVGGADERELALIGDREDDALVLVLEDEGLIAVEEFRHHDVAALDEPHVLVGVEAEFGVENIRHEGAARIDDDAGADLIASACLASSRVATQMSPSRRAETSFVRTRMSAPRSKASRAFSATMRLSSTQQSEYTKAVSKPGFKACPAGWRVRWIVSVPGNRLRGAR